MLLTLRAAEALKRQLAQPEVPLGRGTPKQMALALVLSQHDVY